MGFKENQSKKLKVDRSFQEYYVWATNASGFKCKLMRIWMYKRHLFSLFMYNVTFVVSKECHTAVHVNTNMLLWNKKCQTSCDDHKPIIIYFIILILRSGIIILPHSIITAVIVCWFSFVFPSFYLAKTSSCLPNPIQVTYFVSGGSHRPAKVRGSCLDSLLFKDQQQGTVESALASVQTLIARSLSQR